MMLTRQAVKFLAVAAAMSAFLIEGLLLLARERNRRRLRRDGPMAFCRWVDSLQPYSKPIFFPMKWRRSASFSSGVIVPAFHFR